MFVFYRKITKFYRPMKKIFTLFSLLLVCSASLQAQMKDYPFTLTQEGEEPVLYYIYSGRDGNGGKSSYVFTNVTPWGSSKQALCLNNQDPSPPQLEKNPVVPPSSQDEALSRYSVSGEVPR